MKEYETIGTIPRAIRRMIARNYARTMAGRGYRRGAHGAINERAHILALVGDNVESGYVGIVWTGTSYCDSPGGTPCRSESVIPVPALARPQHFWDLIESSDPWIEGPCGWHSCKPDSELTSKESN